MAAVPESQLNKISKTASDNESAGSEAKVVQNTAVATDAIESAHIAYLTSSTAGKVKP